MTDCRFGGKPQARPKRCKSPCYSLDWGRERRWQLKSAIYLHSNDARIPNAALATAGARHREGICISASKTCARHLRRTGGARVDESPTGDRCCHSLFLHLLRWAPVRCSTLGICYVARTAAEGILARLRPEGTG